MNLGQVGLLKFCLAFLLATHACHSTSREQPSSENEFTIIWGSGGGFTGMAQGYIIHSNGKIEKWSGLDFQRSEVETLGKAQPEALQPIRQMVAAKTMAEWSHQETGNMTTRVWCISGNDTTMVSWPGMEPGKEVPQPIRDFYRDLLNATQSVKKP